MAKVFVVQENNYNFSSAEAWGDLVFMSVDRKDDFHNIVDSEHNQRLLTHLKRKLRGYDPDTDHFILAGSPYVCAAVMWVLGRMGFKKLSILRWDNRDLKYVPLYLEVNL